MKKTAPHLVCVFLVLFKLPCLFSQQPVGVNLASFRQFPKNLDLSALPPGMYVWVLKTSGRDVLRQRIVIHS